MTGFAASRGDGGLQPSMVPAAQRLPCVLGVLLGHWEKCVRVWQTSSCPCLEWHLVMGCALMLLQANAASSHSKGLSMWLHLTSSCWTRHSLSKISGEISDKAETIFAVVLYFTPGPSHCAFCCASTRCVN